MHSRISSLWPQAGRGSDEVEEGEERGRGGEGRGGEGRGGEGRGGEGRGGEGESYNWEVQSFIGPLRV